MAFTMRFAPGGCCCTPPPDCDICTDAFNRADSTDVTTGSACAWTETVGDWSISTNELVVSTTSAILLSNVTKQYFRLKIKVNVDTTRYRVIYGYTDANNYYFFEIVNGSAPTLNRRSAGTNTVLGTATSSFSGSGMTEIEVCAGPEGHTGKSGTVQVAYPVSPASGLIGIGTGTTVGTPKFDDAEILSVEGLCPVCDVPAVLVGGCAPCQDEGAVIKAAPRYIQLDITGVTNGSSCTTCATGHNASFILDIASAFGVADCNWSSPEFTTTCSGSPLIWHYTLQIAKSGADVRYDVRVWQTATANNRATWTLTQVGADPIDCDGISGLSIPISVFENPAPLCYFGSATATITALV